MSLRSRRVAVAGLAALLLYGPVRAPASEAPSAAEPRAHIALLLPTRSAAFGRAAETVHQGFLAGARASGAELPTVLYPLDDGAAETLPALARAVAQGARIIVGPLTRNAVSALAASDSVSVPTIALNVPEHETRSPENLYFFSLQVEWEARQVARMVFEQGLRSALTVSDESALSRRILKAFVDEFVRLGGRQQADFLFSTSPTSLATLRDATASGQADTAFLALSAARARIVRPYLGATLQVFATSQVSETPRTPPETDLDGIRFVDMPWLLQPDRPAVMVYPRPESGFPARDFERLYAFGIDAYRIAADLLRAFSLAREPLDGVTGRIHLTRDRHFVRELTPARFAEGRAVPLGERQ